MIWNKEKPEIFILVRQSDLGIETYFNPKIKQMSSPIKNQLDAFIEEIKKELKQK